MREIKAPEPYQAESSLFLAGSIEMGVAEEWQQRVVALLEGQPVAILNPRRENFGDLGLEAFEEQVSWELDQLEAADHILLYFAPGTKSPISLLELGLFARSGKLTVCCPQGFWREGNVFAVCLRYGVRWFRELDKAVAHIFGTY